MNPWKKAIIIFGSFVSIILLLNNVIMPWYVRHDTLIKVPSVIGLSYPDAERVLDEAGLEAKQGDIRYDPSKPIGTVIEQNPPAEQVVKDGRRIYLVLSGGEQLYEVPNLVGRTVREARFQLAQRNLQLLETESRPSAQYPAGIILAQIETPGTKLRKGTNVSVIVSTGMESGSIKVPDLTGKNVEEAKKLILQNKLAIGKINSQPSTSVPLNAVIDQYPKANAMAKENDKIDLFVNREVKKKIIPPPEEESKMEEISPDENSEIQKPKEERKPDLRKEEKPKQQEKKEEKKRTDKPKDPEKKDEGGTKF